MLFLLPWDPEVLLLVLADCPLNPLEWGFPLSCSSFSCVFWILVGLLDMCCTAFVFFLDFIPCGFGRLLVVLYLPAGMVFPGLGGNFFG